MFPVNYEAGDNHIPNNVNWSGCHSEPAVVNYWTLNPCFLNLIRCVTVMDVKQVAHVYINLTSYRSIQNGCSGEPESAGAGNPE